MNENLRLYNWKADSWLNARNLDLVRLFIGYQWYSNKLKYKNMFTAFLVQIWLDKWQ